MNIKKFLVCFSFLICIIFLCAYMNQPNIVDETSNSGVEECLRSGILRNGDDYVIYTSLQYTISPYEECKINVDWGTEEDGCEQIPMSRSYKIDKRINENEASIFLQCQLIINQQVYDSQYFNSNIFYNIAYDILSNATITVGDSQQLKLQSKKYSEQSLNDMYDSLCDMYEVKYYSAHTKFSQYFQSDYGTTPFSGGTVRSHGCGISSFSMVASYLLDETITPDVLAKKYNRS